MKKSNRLGVVTVCFLLALACLSACETLPIETEGTLSPQVENTPSQTTASTTPSQKPTILPTTHMPTATPSPTHTATPQPTATPPAPKRFTMGENAQITWDGVTRYPATLTRTGNLLNTNEYIEKLIGSGYKESRGASYEDIIYENNGKSLSVRQYAYIYTDVSQGASISLEGKTETDIIEEISVILRNIFPNDMLAEGKLSGTYALNSTGSNVTAEYIRRVNTLPVYDGMEGITVTMNSNGIQSMFFQWSDYVSTDIEIFPTDLNAVIAFLNESQPNGNPVSIEKAELIYANGHNSLGVSYALTWRLTDAGGNTYDVSM